MESWLTFISDWLNSGVYSFFTDAAAWAIEKATISYLSFLAWVIPFAWGIAKSIVQDIGISSALASAWSSLDSQTVQMLTFFKVPDAINNLTVGLVTRLVFRFIPGV